MSPEQADALALEIIRSAAEADAEAGDEPAWSADASGAVTEQDEAVLAFDRAMGVAAPLAGAVAVPSQAGAVSDLDWFNLRPARTARLRPALPEDQRPYWATEGQPLMAAVRWVHTDPRPRVSLHPTEAFAGPVEDTDEAILAAVRASRF